MTKLHWLKLVFVAVCLTLSSIAFAADDPQQASQQVVLLDINTADAASIAAALDGIGLVKAQEIVAYREMFGKFESVDELAEVKGIGAATLEKIRHKIAIVKN